MEKSPQTPNSKSRKRDKKSNISAQRGKESGTTELTSMTWNSHSLVSYDVSFGLYREKDKVSHNTRE